MIIRPKIHSFFFAFIFLCVCVLLYMYKLWIWPYLVILVFCRENRKVKGNYSTLFQDYIYYYFTQNRQLVTRSKGTTHMHQYNLINKFLPSIFVLYRSKFHDTIKYTILLLYKMIGSEDECNDIKHWKCTQKC